MDRGIANQLDFFTSSDHLATKATDSKVVARRSIKAKGHITVDQPITHKQTDFLYKSSFNHKFFDFFESWNSRCKEKIVLYAPEGHGKSYLCHHLDQLNIELRSIVYSAVEIEKILEVTVNDLIFVDIIVLDDLDKVNLDATQLQHLTQKILQLEKTHSLLFPTSNLGKLKKILKDSLWHQTLFLDLDKIKLNESKDYFQQKIGKKSIEMLEVNSLLSRASNLKEIDHFILNLEFNEFRIDAIKKIANFSFSTSQDRKFDVLNNALEEICLKFDLNRGDVFSSSRSQETVLKKHYVYYLLNRQYQVSYLEIAHFFQINHSSVIYAVKKIATSPKVYLRKIKEIALK